MSSGKFTYNAMLASALAQLLPSEERQVIRLWIDRLHNIDDTSEIAIRDEYMWFLLLTLKNRRVTQPFNEKPFSGKLTPLKDLLPKHVYTEVTTKDEGEANLAWVDQVMQRGTTEPPAVPPKGTAAPSQFLQNQPLPQRGIICYMGAFSDQQKL